MTSTRRIQTAKYGYVVLSFLCCLLGASVLAEGGRSAERFCPVCGTLLILFGVFKLLGYLSDDMYCLAFQYDLAAGVLVIALGTVLLFRPTAPAGLVSALLGVYILSDGLLKIQISLDSRTFGLDRWWLILSAAVVASVAGFLLVLRPYGGELVMRWIGAALLAEGVLNLITTLTAVKIRKPAGL